MPTWTEEEYAAFLIRTKLPGTQAEQPLPTPKPSNRRAHKPGVMNDTELAYSRHLDALKLVGEITWWAFEAVVFTLADRATYRPDFMVRLADSAVEVHEVKGFMEDDAAVKIRVFSSMFPFPIYVVKRSNSGWNKKKW